VIDAKLRGGTGKLTCGKHEALKNQTPAMASKLTDHVRTIKELIEKAATH
jgi:hypothetical protein